ncbi:hypothetical protein L0657_04850 [Dyadobacter sp. CY345]|uniref:hypothetical protein n=1 Tax=Dyadobacter sp. CY345 TaxID=2909335 RepID=UPI001F24B88F|nr:hypothetical protein [Dyadobacter sp. CY345]MCF2443276.1 hypothetical protein [Dyadobacter sp. CY345]
MFDKKIEIMKLNFVKASELDGNIKATIHKSGKLGFSSGAHKKLELDKNRFIKIAFGEDYSETKILFAILHEDEDTDSFNIAKAGDYYYGNTKALFDELEIDYETQKVIYDIKETQYDGKKIFKLKPRIFEREKKYGNEKDINEVEQ